MRSAAVVSQPATRSSGRAASSSRDAVAAESPAWLTARHAMLFMPSGRQIRLRTEIWPADGTQVYPAVAHRHALGGQPGELLDAHRFRGRPVGADDPEPRHGATPARQR